MIELLFVAVGLVFVWVSFTRWSKEPASARAREEGEPPRDPVRAVLFGLWLVALPTFFLVRWYLIQAGVLAKPEDMTAYQYDHKLWSDL
jgi:hypothetical protein